MDEELSEPVKAALIAAAATLTVSYAEFEHRKLHAIAFGEGKHMVDSGLTMVPDDEYSGGSFRSMAMAFTLMLYQLESALKETHNWPPLGPAPRKSE